MDYRLSKVEKIIVLFYSLSPFMYLVRVFIGDTLIAFVAIRAMQPILIVVLIVSVLKSRLRFDYYSLIFFSLLIFGVSVAILNNNEYFDIVTGVSHFSVGLLLYLYYSTRYVSDARLAHFFHWICVFYTVSVASVLLFIYLANSLYGLNIYIGLATQAMIPLFFYSIFRRNYLLSLLVLALIVLSGKRGVLVALLFSIIIFTIPFVLSSFRSYLTRFFLVACFASITTVMAVSFSNLNLSVLENLREKLEFSDEKSLDEYSSGRYFELLSALQFWTKNDERFWFGAGFGYTYTYSRPDDSLQPVTDYKNVHFSYLNPLIVFGLPLGVLYIFSLLSLSVRVFLAKTHQLSLKWVMKASVWGYLVYASSAFILFNEPLFWMLLSVLASRRNDQNV